MKEQHKKNETGEVNTEKEKISELGLKFQPHNVLLKIKPTFHNFIWTNYNYFSCKQKIW